MSYICSKLYRYGGIRINKLLRQFNVELDEMVDYLQSLGVQVDYNPNAKISGEYLPLLQSKFGAKKESDTTKKSIANRAISPEEFDWEVFERCKAERIADSVQKFVDTHLVEGEVTEVNNREVVVTINVKRNGGIPVSEFRYNPDIKVGDKVEVYIEALEDKKGQLVLSHRKARILKSWDRVNEAYENNEIVKGFVKARTKGGMIVDVFGVEAFLPYS